MVEPITVSRLAIGFIPLVGLLVWMWWGGQMLRDVGLGLARMTIQLVTVGYALVHLFDAGHPVVTISMFSVMLTAASWIATRTGRQHRAARIMAAAISLAIGSAITLGITFAFVLPVDSLSQMRTIIPIAGMALSSAMTAISLALERFDSAYAELGPVNEENLIAIKQIGDAAFRTAMIPMTNSLMAVGLVSLPGMMTGQVLAGVDPTIAARYQIMIMVLLFTTAGLATKIFLRQLVIRPSLRCGF